jgi:hypothetical protein
MFETESPVQYVVRRLVEHETRLALDADVKWRHLQKAYEGPNKPAVVKIKRPLLFNLEQSNA